MAKLFRSTNLPTQKIPSIKQNLNIIFSLQRNSQFGRSAECLFWQYFSQLQCKITQHAKCTNGTIHLDISYTKYNCIVGALTNLKETNYSCS